MLPAETAGRHETRKVGTVEDRGRDMRQEGRGTTPLTLAPAFTCHPLAHTIPALPLAAPCLGPHPSPTFYSPRTLLCHPHLVPSPSLGPLTPTSHLCMPLPTLPHPQTLPPTPLCIPQFTFPTPLHPHLCPHPKIPFPFLPAIHMTFLPLGDLPPTSPHLPVHCYPCHLHFFPLPPPFYGEGIFLWVWCVVL